MVHYNCSFIGSTATLIDGEVLKKLIPVDPLRTEDNYHLSIYEDPIPGALYVMGVDSSTGVGNDYCTVQIIKILNQDLFEEVAVYKNNKIKPYEFAQVIAKLGCGNILNTDRRGIGTRATSQSKLDACMMLKKALELGKLKLHDEETITQLGRFEEITPNNFRGAKGSHDDLVSSLYWAVYCLNQPQIDLEGAKMVTQSVQDEYAPPPCMFDESSDNSDFWRSFN